jgi:phosphate acetyltransferase
MDTISMIRQKARNKKRTIVLPEYNDNRVIEAAEIIEKEGIARALLLTPDRINRQEKENFAQDFYELRKAKGMSLEVARKTMDDPLYYAAMMVRKGLVDGFVAGASNITPSVVRAAIQCLEVDERISIASSAFIMVVPNTSYGENGTLIFADCGVIPEPNARQMAFVAISSAELVSKVLGFLPRIAMLSYSTRGSAQGKTIERITEALGLVRELAPGLLIDGELQVDAALVPEVAKIKYPDSPLGGRANILIFPNLDAGNIGYKLVQRLANARAVGPILLGLKKPCSDLSRGCMVSDVIDCVAVTAIRAQ